MGEVLFGIFSQSNTLSSYLINNPEKLFWIIENDSMTMEKTKDDFYTDILHILSKTDNHKKREYYLRQYRKSEYLRIAAKEIIKATDFISIMRELSYLASALIDAALWCAKEKLKGRYGVDDGICVIGMGKLGNMELNFSSDIDLLFVHNDAEKGNYFNRLAQETISILNDNKEGGFVYRVDMRLRPGGKSSALSLSVDEYENYYATFGQLWEKMALTKAYPVAGDYELGFLFLETIKPFVYRKSIDIEYIQEIRSLMFKIKKYAHKPSSFERIPIEKVDVKKGVGGIREIEFIVNYFQLVYGGNIKELQHIGTLDAINLLCEKGLIEKQEKELLYSAYLFLRRIEHKIQLLNEQQTQSLPLDKKELEKLARKLDLNLDAFVKKYLNVTDRVHEIFKKIFISNNRFPVFSADEDIEGFLYEHGINNAATVSNLIKSAVKKFLAKDIKRSQIEDIFDYAFNYVKKDLFETCMGGLNIINPTYTTLAFKQRQVFEAFLKVLSIGLADKFSKHLDLLEDILLGEMLNYNELSIFEHERLSLGVILHLFLKPFSYSPNILSQFAFDFIKKAVSKYDKDNVLAVVGYGKLATGELFVGSDLDIVFVAKQDAYMYTSTVQKIVKELKQIYEVDLRLRPYGDKGSIVVDVDYLDKYFQNNAWPWEKQAAQKSRIIYCGFDESLLYGVYERFIFNKPPSKGDIYDMKRKIEDAKGKDYDIKSFKGGISDIEFLAQAVCFENGCVKLGLSTLELLDLIEKKGIINTDKLKEIYKFYVSTLNVYRTFAKGSVIKNFETLEFLCGKQSLKEEIEEHRKIVREIFEKVFE